MKLNRKLNDKKIAIVIHARELDVSKNISAILENLIIPPNYKVESIVITGGENVASAYNEGIKQSDAKYKIYIDKNIVCLKNNILEEILDGFRYNTHVGMLGILGSEIPITADFFKATSRYGAYLFFQDNNVKKYEYVNPCYAQEVESIDSGIVATCHDILWDEEVGNDFFMAAQCCKFRKYGHRVIVPMATDNWGVFSKNTIYNTELKNDEYCAKRILFLNKYRNNILPLVSILIPVYNQVYLFEKALKSALNQDYNNIEIIIGDDSTNEDIKKIMQPYLKKYDNISYYYHGGPLGGNGKKNMAFLLEHAQGDYINYLFHDDLFYPGKIRRMMTYFIADLNDDVHIVTSVRDRIDGSGRVEGIMNHYCPFNNTILEGNEVGRKILFTMSNFIGELTTCLIRKSILKDSRRGGYAIGVYGGICDKSLMDVATWLNVCRNGGKCVFIAEPLSAFRYIADNSEQNSNKVSVIVLSLSDWLKYVTVSWLTDTYITNIEEYEEICLQWKGLAEYVCTRSLVVNEMSGSIENALSRKISLYKKICFAISNNEFANVLHLSILDILDDDLDENEYLFNFCKKNLNTNTWEKR